MALQITQTQNPTGTINVFSSIIDLGPLYVRQGPSFVSDRRAWLVGFKGPVYVAQRGEFDEGYPYRKGYRNNYVAVTPETEYVIIKMIEKDDTVEPKIDEEYYIVYIRRFGWWVFKGNDAKPLSPVKATEIVDKLEWTEAYMGMEI